MNGCTFKRQLKSGVGWGYSFFAGVDENGKRLQIYKSGFETKKAAEKAQREAIAEYDTKCGRITQHIGLLKQRTFGYVLGETTKNGFQSRSAAETALKKAIEQRAAKDRAGTNLTVAGYFAYWLTEHAARHCAPKTLERYKELGRYFVRHLGETPLDELATEQVQRMIHTLEDHGGQVTKNYPLGRPLAPKTVRNISTLLYTLLSEAMRLGVLKIHPMANRSVRLPKRVKRDPAVLDTEKLRLLFDRARSTRLYPLIVLASATGCRRGELLALEWSDLDDVGKLRVSKSLEQTRAGLRVKGTKSDKPRNFAVPEWALEVLRAHRVEQDRDKELYGPGYQDHNLIFCQPEGGYYSPDRIGARVVELMRKVGLSGVSLHSLRHSHASHLLSKGVPLAVVSERLGHADQNITLSIYSHAIPADTKAAAKVWNDAMVEVISDARKTVVSRAC
jgi:integrase